MIAQNTTWERLNLYGKEKNVSGFSNDLLQEISQLEKFKIKLVQTNQFPVVDLLKDEGIDAVLSTLSPDERNIKLYQFSDPYFTVGPVLVVKEGSLISSIQDLQGRGVGFERGYNWAISLAARTDIIFQPYSEVSQAFDALKRGEIEGVLCDSMVANHMVQAHYKGILRLTGPLVDFMGIRLVVKKGKNEELIVQFNEGLKKVKETGLYYKVLRYWSLFDMSEPLI